MQTLAKRAIVVGASMGGLVAAKALAAQFQEVLVIERDTLPTGIEPRKGVPQGRHTHGLLARGREALEELFPGLIEELIAAGAQAGDLSGDTFWYNHGVYLSQSRSALQGLLVSRPMLESHVRRRLLQLPNVRIAEHRSVDALVFDASNKRVIGLRVEDREHGTIETLDADQVVDASGRGTRTPAWLREAGYPEPAEEKVEVGIGYMTRSYRRRPEELGGKMAAIMAACDPEWRMGAMLAQEGSRWMVSLGGYFGDHPPADPQGYLEFAKSLPKPEIYNALRVAEPLSDPMPFHYPASVRRRYERLSAFPEGYLVFGDALCSFNPVYGQGMTVAACEALALEKCLAEGSKGLARRFFAAAAKTIDIPWQIAVGSDMQHPRLRAEMPLQARFINWYISRFYRAGRQDDLLAIQFLEVANLMRRPESLLSPKLAWRVWRSGAASSEVLKPELQ
jgi:2-polyprenyl-6-methoxyphenol hydroxylase-like FAD-dependent oxidoreductase